MAKWVYAFGGGKAEGGARMKGLLGGKGANLAEMSSLGLPVPPGFTITTEVCSYFYAHDRRYPEDLAPAVDAAVGEIERELGMRFGDPENPLLVSVRSGAPVSMPGMMDTVLNLGLNDRTVEGLAARSEDRRFAYDSYRRFIQMYGDVVLGVDHYLFEEALEELKRAKGARFDTELDAAALSQLVKRYKQIVAKDTGKEFPQDPKDQLWGAIGAVFGSWETPRAVTYRRLNGIAHDMGTAVSVQAMVFGNMGEDCATGVAFTRNPSTGEKAYYGEFLINAQGEDVVAGIRTPQPLTRAMAEAGGSEAQGNALEECLPQTFRELVEVFDRLEAHYRDMQDIEFTVQQGRLFVLQTRSGKRTAAAALKVAVDMARDGLISEDEAVLRVEPASLDQLLHPTLDPKAERKIVTKALPASPGAVSGKVVFSADEAERAAKAGEEVILVRIETSPDDIHGMHAAKGILTARGGMTSHAAVVARGMGKACVCGAGDLMISYAEPHHHLPRHGRPRGRGDHDRRRRGHGDAGPRPDRRPAAVGRLRDAHGLGRRAPPAQGADQRRDADRREHRRPLRRGGHRPLPHRAHVLRARADHRHAGDDPGRGRRGAAAGARQDPADAARRLRRAVRDHARPAGDGAAARPAAARVPAARAEGHGGGREGRQRRAQGRAPPPRRAAGGEPDAGPARLPARHRLPRDLRDAGARHLRGGARWSASATARP